MEPERQRHLVESPPSLAIHADAFKTASGNLEDSLRMICEKVHAFGDVKVRKR